ncbi:MAG: cupin domain-containing protein [Lysobacterales bacterium]
MKPILNVADAAEMELSSGSRFETRMRRLAQPLGARRIGSNVTTVPPGKAAFPLHHHFANEEHFFVLAGTGVLRHGDEWFDVKPQDYIYCAPGDAQFAHQLINTGDVDLVYLAISTMQLPEVVGYPDSDKTGVAVAPFGELPARFLLENKLRDTQGYWDGEDGAAIERILGGEAPAKGSVE